MGVFVVSSGCVYMTGGVREGNSGKTEGKIGEKCVLCVCVWGSFVC
jgi:hypothetical protein